MVTYSTTPQNTPEWLAERCGLITASNAKKITGKRGKTMDDYLYQLASERLNGPSVMNSIPTTAAMQWGIDHEPQARALCAFENDIEIFEVGLATNTDYPGCGASLDGLSGKIGLELKCPQPKTMRRYLHEDRLPPEYRDQVVFQQLICDLEATWFFAWHPDEANGPLNLLIHRDEAACKEMAARINDANCMIERYMG